MEFEPLSIPGAFAIHFTPFGDERGKFTRFFCQRELKAAGLEEPIVQVNGSFTARKGAVRGLHFQYPPHAEIKCVTCLKGGVNDYLVDLRKDSPTFLHHVVRNLNEKNGIMLFIPKGVAHGFQTLEEDTELLYFHTEYYTPSAEGGASFFDPRLKLHLSLPVADISKRDEAHPFLSPEFIGIEL